VVIKILKEGIFATNACLLWWVIENMGYWVLSVIPELSCESGAGRNEKSIICRIPHSYTPAD
jgi:hypothetical protein